MRLSISSILGNWREFEIDELGLGYGKLRTANPPPTTPSTPRPPNPPGGTRILTKYFSIFVPVVNFDCTLRPDGNFAGGACSVDFFTCSNGIAFLQTCPGGSVFSQ